MCIYSPRSCLLLLYLFIHLMLTFYKSTLRAFIFIFLCNSFSKKLLLTEQLNLDANYNGIRYLRVVGTVYSLNKYISILLMQQHPYKPLPLTCKISKTSNLGIESRSLAQKSPGYKPKTIRDRKLIFNYI